MEGEPEQRNTSQHSLNVYQEILDQYDTALIQEWDMQRLVDEGLCYLCGYYEDPSEIGYTCIDIDGNGVEELLICQSLQGDEYKGMILDLYTVKDGQAVQILRSEERNRYYLCEDYIIANESSASALQSQVSFHTLKDGSSLMLIETILYDAYRDEKNPWFYGTTVDDDSYVSVTEAQAKNRMDAHVYMDISFTPFSEYEDREKDGWETFLSSGEYRDYLSDGRSIESLQYTIYDINSDGDKELLITGRGEPSFYSTWVFKCTNDEIQCVFESYGYGMYTYSPEKNAVLVSPETQPLNGTGYIPFYQMEGENFSYKFKIGQDKGECYYEDASGKRSISAEEWNAYYTEVVYFEWRDLQY